MCFKYIYIYIQGVSEFADTECITWLSVSKEATFFSSKIESEHYFLNQSNLNLTNKRSRSCMNQERRAHGVARERVRFFTISLKIL